MTTSGFEGSFMGDVSRIAPETKLECGVCWWVYDPKIGDEVWQIPPGVAFAELPSHWRCPNCDAAQHQFMTLDDGRAAAERPKRAAGAVALEKRVAGLLEGYRAAEARMRGLPVFNAALRVEAVGFRRWEDVFIGVVVTPWCMNLVRVPVDPEADVPPEGAERRRALPSGGYTFVSGRMPGFGAFESCSLFSPMEAFEDPDVARLVAEHAIEGAFVAEPAAEPEPAEETTAATPSDASRAAVSRRAFLGAAPPA